MSLTSEQIPNDQVAGDMSVTLLCLVFLVCLGFIVYCVANFLAYSFVRPRQRTPDSSNVPNGDDNRSNQSELSRVLSIPPLFLAKFGNSRESHWLYSCSSALVDGWKGAVFYLNVLIILGVATSSIDFDKIYNEQKLLLLFSEPAQNFLPLKTFHISTTFFFAVFITVLMLSLMVVNILLESSRWFVWGSGLLNSLLFCILSLISVYYQMIKLSIIFLIILGLSLRFITAPSLRENIDFPSKLLRIASLALRENFQGILSDGIVAMFYQAVWTLLCSMAVYAVTVHLKVLDDSKDQSSQSVIVVSIYIWLMISLFWGMECIKDVVALTTSGTVISWIFLPRQAAPVRASFFRAISSLFGTICFGSLFLTIVQNIRHMLWVIMTALISDEWCFCFSRWSWIAKLVLDTLEQNVGFLNRYTYAYVAGHGYDLRGAGNHVIDTLERKNLHVLVQDDILVSSFWLCTIFLTVLSAGIGILLTALFLMFDTQSDAVSSTRTVLHPDLTHIDMNMEGGAQVASSLVEEASDALATVYLVGGVYGALVGFVVSSFIISMLDIAAATVLVCLAEDSEDMLVS